MDIDEYTKKETSYPNMHEAEQFLRNPKNPSFKSSSKRKNAHFSSTGTTALSELKYPKSVIKDLSFPHGIP